MVLAGYIARDLFGASSDAWHLGETLAADVRRRWILG
jgi:hypothetical protein